MSTQAFSEFENQFARLSPEAQLSLLERLVHQIRLNVAGQPEIASEQLSVMASDPEIQTELKQINAEFINAEMDGLERR